MSEVLHIVVEGRVQGVGYRYYAREVARRLGVAGWVRNLPGGEVEVLARVEPSRQGRFLALLREGPSMSRVERLRVERAGAEADCPETGFSVRY